MAGGITRGITRGITMTVDAILADAEAVICRPWLRHLLSPAAWTALIDALRTEPHRLLALWADTTEVHALLLHDAALTVALASTKLRDGAYPAVSPVRPNAAPFERMIRDLWGHAATGGLDARPWLDHGQWPLSLPLSPRPGPPPIDYTPPAFPAAEDDHATRLPLGPVAGQLDSAAHLRLTLLADRIRAADPHLGYTHKGTLALMRGKSPRAAARFVARLSAEATVAHGIAFAHAAEAALDVAAPPRATALRALMLEWERVVVHLARFAELGAIADAPGLAHGAALAAEDLTRAAEAAFGHRLIMDVVVPGGVSQDIAADGQVVLRAALARVAAVPEALAAALRHPPLVNRLDGVGHAPLALVRRFAVGGVVGRAAGRAIDAREMLPTADGLTPEPLPDRHGAARVGHPADARARCALRLREIAASLRLLDRLSAILPDGPVSVPLPGGSGEGIGCAEAADGDVWHWLRLDHGHIAATFPRDPGWALWPLAAAVLAGGDPRDVALVRCSLGLTTSGMDL
jgi:Ni,Fe-hydrogenase III large subunit